jgi:hypothetical protein
MNANYKSIVQKLDLGGMEAREEQRRIQKQEAHKPQQITIDGAEAYRRGLRSYLSEAYREIAVEKLKGDPALAFFLLANRDPSSA